MSERFPLYTTDYISGVMSLRKPQTASLRILEEIVTSVNLRKGMNLKAALGSVHAMYPTCSDFEREFMSLTFTLATGVGKTRLMGAFIAYLYTQHNIKNFFVVAPNTTIYDKRKKDLNNNKLHQRLQAPSMCSAAWAASPYCCRLSLMMITGTKVYPYMIRIFIFSFIISTSSTKRAPICAR